MYYEYFVTKDNGDKISILSEEANLSVIDDNEPIYNYCNCCGHYTKTYCSSYVVDYCIIHQGNKPMTYQEQEDMDDRMEVMD